MTTIYDSELPFEIYEGSKEELVVPPTILELCTTTFSYLTSTQNVKPVVGLLGSQGVGRHFMADLIANVYRQKFASELKNELKFVKYSSASPSALNKSKNVRRLFNTFRDRYLPEVPNDQICIITDDLSVCSVLQGTGVYTIAIMSREELDKHDEFRSLELAIMNLDNLHLPYKEMELCIKGNTLNSVNSIYKNLQLSVEDVDDFLEITYKISMEEYYNRNPIEFLSDDRGEEDDDADDETEEGLEFKIPPGFVSVILNRIASIYALERTDKKNYSFKDCLDDYSYFILDAIEEFLNSSSGGAPRVVETYMMNEDGELERVSDGSAGIMDAIMGMVSGAQAANGNPMTAQSSSNDASEFNTPKVFGQKLRENIFSQDEAISAVKKAMTIPAAKLNDPARPLRSLLMLGPTGVGKTETALTIAKHMRKEPMNLVRLDMSEYSSPHEVSKLFGAPPGYVGGGSGILTRAVAQNPHSVILMDEAEKAHPDVWDSILQVLDAGRMTQGDGLVVDFTNTVIILTSNVGSKEMNKNRAGFSSGVDQSDDKRKIAERALKEYFKAEFLGRINDVIHFKELDQEAIKSILSKKISEVSSRLESSGVSLKSPSDDILTMLASKVTSTEYGARGVSRYVTDYITQPIAEFIANDETASCRGKNLHIKLKNDSLNFYLGRKKVNS